MVGATKGGKKVVRLHIWHNIFYTQSPVNVGTSILHNYITNIHTAVVKLLALLTSNFVFVLESRLADMSFSILEGAPQCSKYFQARLFPKTFSCMVRQPGALTIPLVHYSTSLTIILTGMFITYHSQRG